MKSLEAAIGTGQRDTHTHWTPAAKKALVRPTNPSAVTLLLDSGYNLRETRSKRSGGPIQPHRPGDIFEKLYLRTTSLTAKHRSNISAAVRRKSFSGGLSHTLSTSHTLSPSSLISSEPLSPSGLP